MKKMSCTDHGTKLTVTERKDGTYKLVMDDCCGDHYETVCENFYSAGCWVYEMADNNDQGAKFNRKMCERFERTFA